MTIAYDFLKTARDRLVIIYTRWEDEIEGRIVAFDERHLVIVCDRPDSSMKGMYLLKTEDISGISICSQMEVVPP